MQLRNLHGSRFNARTSNEEWYSYVELEGEALAFYQSKLSQMISVIGRVNDVCIVQFAQILQFLIDLWWNQDDEVMIREYKIIMAMYSLKTLNVLDYSTQKLNVPYPRRHQRSAVSAVVLSSRDP
jgi:hypothetical protein